MTSSELEREARALAQHLAQGCTQKYGLGSMTPAIYDTAWVSMISKTVDGNPRWLFPECFQFLLDTQLLDGDWESYASNDDGILNTMAALLALKRHGSAPYSTDELPFDFESRMSDAVTCLQSKLQQWDVEASVHVGFEVVIPALLLLLEEENVLFDFPGRQSLMRLNRKKLEKFDPRIMYGSTETTLLHSLEAFIGKIDFDRVGHHTRFGSMMASPSSTAAYLMNSSSWDDEAETYIGTTVMYGEGKGTGGVPSAFPSTNFELTWVLSTLLQGGFSVESLGKENIDSITSYLESHLQAQSGLLGFAPSLLADADDTAKAIFTLSLLGRPASLDEMIANFGAKNGHFQTYVGERDCSFSANCNVLIALLHASDPHQYESRISSITTFLCDSWWNGIIKDKWNLSPQYSMMLLAEALVCLLRLWDNGHLQSISQHLIHDRIPVVLTQITNRTLLSQNSNGAWSANDLPEVTGYAVLTLVAISSLPWLNLLETEVAAAVNKGRRFLSQSKEQWGEARYIWVEKVTYGSTVLSQAYCLAAMNAPTPSHVWSDTMVRLIDIPSKAIAKLSHFFSVLNLPVFSNEPGWKVKASVLEGYLFLPQLKRARSDIFPHQGNAKDQYLDFIPCTWTIINNCGGIFLDTNLIWDMMEISMLDFLVDEYMESVVVQLPENELESLERIIGRLCEKPKAQTNGTKKRPYPDDNSKEFTNGSITSPTPNGIEQAHRLIEIRNVLNRYVRYILDHPRITRASISDQHTLRTELQTFLLAHLTQIRDNARFSHQDFLPSTTTTTKPFLTPRTAYYTWTHTTAAEHISCPFSFAFYACLLGSSSTSPSNSNNVRDDCFPSAVQKYLAQDLCTHLAVMSRLYNDYASIARDRAEKNLNSVNFPEFHPPSLLHTSATVTTHTTYLNDDELESKLKTAVLQLAEYERACVGMVAGRLVEGLKASGKMGKRTADAVGLFVAVTELYAEMYVVRDLTNRVK